MSEIRIYVEGGGDQRSGKAAVQEGFGKFLSSLNEEARKHHIRWHVVACGSRQSTFDDFEIALRQHRDAFNVLLVDAEDPVTQSPWEHLKHRDNWSIKGISNDHCYLMVQVMEPWIVADIETLTGFYGQGFNRNSIPRQRDVELILKADLERSLIQATRNTQKGEYHKIRHGPKILALLDVSKVRNRARHCDRMFTILSDKIAVT